VSYDKSNETAGKKIMNFIVLFRVWIVEVDPKLIIRVLSN